MTGPELHAYGDGWLLEHPDPLALLDAVRHAPGVDDAVPAEGWLLARGAGAREALERACVPGAAVASTSGGEVVLSVRYDGPDVDAIPGLSAEEVVRLHTGAGYVAAFCGFAPGFAYLRGLPEQLRLPRRDTPRPRVAAGSVAIGGGWCGVYPTESPGGWLLLGTTDAVLFDPAREPAALLQPGTRVRFTAL